MLNRRASLGASLGSLAVSSICLPSFAQGGPASEIQGATPEGAHDSLLLTWQRDPTTTITIQWIGPERADGFSIQYAPLDDQVLQAAGVLAKPYTGTDLKVYR